LLLEVNKNLPRSNEEIEVGKFLFSIESVDQKRIKRVRVFRKS
jgi:CBS domain containing-hemolysin-like protein